MREIAGQLVFIRRVGRLMLIAQRIMQWTCMMAAVVLFGGVLDYLLRFPSWFRFIIDLVVIFTAGTWLLSRLSHAARFRPSLDELAVRAERVFPQLAGVLASAIEFTVHAQQYRHPSSTAALTMSSIERAATQVDGLRLYRMLDPKRMLQSAMIVSITLLSLAAVIWMSPQSSQIAASRWFVPFGATQWPRRVLIKDVSEQRVCPIDSPVRLAAVIERGYYLGMRVRVNYRLVGSDREVGKWQTLLMTEQRGVTSAGTDESGVYERLIELPWSVSHVVTGDQNRRGWLEYSMEAGDDWTATSRITLVNRPATTSVSVDVRPPEYAAGLVSKQNLNLHEQSSQVATASALTGSEVVFRIDFNKSMPATNLGIGEVVPGFASIPGIESQRLMPGSEAGDDLAGALSLYFVVKDTVETQIHLMDEYGLSSYSDRHYRVEAVLDELPNVSLITPATDESVLPTAMVNVEAVSQDDIGLELLTIEAVLPDVPQSNDNQDGGSTIELARQTGRQVSLTAAASLDLSKLDVHSGDVITLYGTCQDVYELDGDRHDMVRSTPRRLHVIDEAALIGQIRSELAGLRQQAIRLELAQRQQEELPPDRSQPQQVQITRRLDSQLDLIESLQERVESNRLDEQSISQLMAASAQLLNQASQASRNIEALLQQAMEDPEGEQRLLRQAGSEQVRVRQNLQELISLLDQGKDALDLQLQLRQLQSLQDSLAADTRQLLPQTVGQELKQLPEDLRQTLRELAERQANLAEQANSMVRGMQATAEVLSRQGESDQDQATAQALAEAAAIARRQGLAETMQQSSGSIDKNKLSQAGQEQLDSLDILQQMLREVGSQQKRMQAMLRRRLEKLEQLIEELVHRQKQQIEFLDAVKADDDIVQLEQPQSAIRLSTMSAQEQASLSSNTLEVAEQLSEAIDQQADAIISLRQLHRLQATNAQRSALVHLESALELLRKVRQEAEEDLVRKQREKLKQAYEKLAQHQDQLTDQVKLLFMLQALTRQHKSQLRTFAQEEQAIQVEAEQLKEKVEHTLVFDQMHRRIDESLVRLVNKLGRAVVDEDVQLDQQQVSIMLWAMAEALDEDRRDEQFAGQSPGSGGSGGGGMMPPLVPPVAELKLLKAMQEAVYQRTRVVDDGIRKPVSESDQVRLLELSTRQRELSSLGQRLIDKMQEALPTSPKVPREMQ